MGKKLAIFDLDGTLIDAYDSIYKTINYISEKLNYRKFEYKEVKKAVGGGDGKLILNLFKEDYVKEAHSLYKKFYLDFLKNNVKIINGVYEFLTELKKRNLKIGVATNRSRFSVYPLLNEVGLENFFDVILCRDDVEEGKPNPVMILKIIEKFNFDKKDAFYVGDMDIDYETGKKAGVDTYIVLTGSSERQDFEKFTNSPPFFMNMNELKKFLIENKII